MMEVWLYRSVLFGFRFCYRVCGLLLPTARSLPVLLAVSENGI